ncbi:MAG TPA: glycosyltransferase, partial [Taishania sp.]|nr:glycosyltransferase [Taishania sp.]
ISSNTGGIPEVNEHGFSGFTSNVGEVQDMANNTLKILQSDETLTQFKKNAKLQAQKFELDKILPMYEDLYQQVVNL